MIRIDFIPCGWEQKSWIEGFYPDDLPEEWRLSYYANEFSSVLLPKATWIVAADTEVEGWVTDLPAGFRVYLEGACTEYDCKLGRVLSALGGHLVGVINGDRGSRKPGHVSFSFCETPVEAVRFAGPVACSVPGPSIDDLPAARRMLEGLVRRPGSAPAVVMLEPVSPDALHRWWQLAHLAGLA